MKKHLPWSLAAALLLAAFFLATSIRIASHRLFWFDELFTISISRLPNLSTMMQALKADNNMPLPYFLVVHFFENLFGHSEMAARLPSALAIAAGLLIAFDCARRLTDGLHGLLTAAFLLCTYLPYFGYEARSYGIYFMFAALAFWVWTNTGEKLFSAIVFGAVFLCGLLFHYYFVLCLAPYALWEAARWRPWRRPSNKLIAGVLGIACAVALLSGQILGANRYSATFWSKPSLLALREAYSAIFPDAAFLLALIMVLAAWVMAPRQKVIPLEPMPPAEAVGWLCLAIPLAGFVLAKLVTHAFVDRYFIGMLPGIAVAFACLIWRHFREARWLATGVVVLLAGVGLYRQFEVVRHPESIDPFNQQTQTRAMLGLENRLMNDGKQFFLFSTGMLYFPSHFYSPHAGNYVLLVPSDKDLETANTLRYVYALRRYYPMQAWNLEDLKIHAPQTALIEPGPNDLAALANAGFQPRLVYTQPLRVAYLAFP